MLICVESGRNQFPIGAVIRRIPELERTFTVTGVRHFRGIIAEYYRSIQPRIRSRDDIEIPEYRIVPIAGERSGIISRDDGVSGNRTGCINTETDTTECFIR